jgi:DNA-binding transcriptional LysR family regulator
MLSLRHIEVFHAVYVSGSVSAAARVLNVSQPSVTKVVKHAETMLGFALFDRRGGRLVATQDAHTMHSEVADIVDRVHSLRKTGSNLRFGRAGALKVSSLPSLSLNVIPKTVAAFLAERSDVYFDLQTLHHEDIVRKLYERETDIAIAYETPHSMPVHSRSVGSGEPVVFFRKSEIPDPPARLTMRDLEAHDFISLIKSGPIGHQLASELKRFDVTLREVVSARTFYIAGGLVKAGTGVAIIDSFSALAMLDDQTDFRPLEPAIRFDVLAISMESRPLSALGLLFIKKLERTLKDFAV